MNKTLKKVAVTALALAFVTAGATAMACDGPQGERGHKGPKDPEKRLEHMTEKLELSGEQRDQVKKIFESQRSKHEAGREEFKADLAKVLSKEQMEKFEAMHRKGPHGDRGDGPDGKPE